MKNDKAHLIFPYLNLLRFIAAIVVVFHHFSIQVVPFNEGVLNQWIGNGNFMVNLFFVLSGFVLFHRYQNSDFCTFREYIVFYKKRAKRLLPLYYLGLILSLVYYIYVVGQVDVLRVVVAFVGVQSFDIWSYPVINVPSWSLSVEFFLYLMFPFVFIFLVEKSKQFILVFSAAIWLITEVVFHFSQATYTDLNLDFIPFFSLPSFVIGMACYQLLDPLKNLTKYTKLCLVLIITGVTIIVLFQPYFYKNYSGLLAPLFGLLILSLAAIDTALVKGNWMDRLGELSYPIYILHWPIYFIYGLGLEYYGVPSRHTLEVFISYVLLVLVISALANFLQKKIKKKATRNLPLTN